MGSKFFLPGKKGWGSKVVQVLPTSTGCDVEVDYVVRTVLRKEQSGGRVFKWGGGGQCFPAVRCSAIFPKVRSYLQYHIRRTCHQKIHSAMNIITGQIENTELTN